VASAAGISPATVLDVRKRLERGESPVPKRPGTPAAASNGSTEPDKATGIPGIAANGAAQNTRPSARTGIRSPAATVERLLRDPSLRNNDQGKGMLRLLHVNAVGAEQLQDVATAVPPHCVEIVVQLANHYAKMWQDFAQDLDSRARIIYQHHSC
jgi:hypothetical protein